MAFTAGCNVTTTPIIAVSTPTLSIISNAWITYSSYINHPGGGVSHDFTFNMLSNGTPILDTTMLVTVGSSYKHNISFTYLDQAVSGTRTYSISAVCSQSNGGNVSNSTMVVSYL